MNSRPARPIPRAWVIAIVISIALGGCALPTAPTLAIFTEDWAGWVEPGHLTLVNIRFTRANGRLTAKACTYTRYGFMGLDDVPVTLASHGSQISMNYGSDLLAGGITDHILTLRGQHHYSYLYPQSSSGYCAAVRK